MATDIVKFEPEQVKLIRTSIVPGLNENEFEVFMEYCKRRQLDPLKKQIYAYASQGKLVFVTSIDGLRAIAQRSGRYMGQTIQQWCGRDGIWKDIWLSAEPPAAARVGVYIKGISEPTYAVARYSSYYPADAKKAFMWNKYPDLMISKCAEGLALRKAFPEDLGGLYVTEELESSDNSNYHASVETPPAALPTVDLTKEQKRPYTAEYLQNKIRAKIEESQLDEVINENELSELEGIFEGFLDADKKAFKAFYGYLTGGAVEFIERRCYDALRQWLGVKYDSEGVITINKHAKTEYDRVIEACNG